MQIKKGIEKVPGGMMIIPLLVGAVLNTLFPNVAKTYGGFTGALFTGALPLLAAFYVCMGATIDFRATGKIVAKGGVLLLSKILASIVVGFVFGKILGNNVVAGGLFTGFSVLAMVAAMNDTNGGLYMALMGEFGTKEEVGAYALMSLESGPFLTMVTLGAAGLASFPWQTMVGAILPLLVGMLLGNLDHHMGEFLGKGVPVLVPFFAFALGAGLNLKTVATAGLSGIILGILVVVVTGIVLIIADKLTGGNGVAGIAAASTAGNAAGVPAAVAAADKTYAAAAPQATALVAASVIVTAILVPLVTAWWYRRVTPQKVK